MKFNCLFDMISIYETFYGIFHFLKIPFNKLKKGFTSSLPSLYLSSSFAAKDASIKDQAKRMVSPHIAMYPKYFTAMDNKNIPTIHIAICLCNLLILTPHSLFIL